MSKFLGKVGSIFSRTSEWSRATWKAKLDSCKDIDWKKGIAETASNGAVLATEITVIVGTFQIITHYFVNFTFCVGPSMLPTINQRGDVVLIDLFSYNIMDGEYKTGDVVISLNPYDAKRTVCKRIAATAGEVIFISKDAPTGTSGSSSNGLAITKPEVPNTNSKNSSFSDVSSRSSNFDSRSSICIGGEAGYSLSSCSAEERTGLQSICNSPPDIDSSAGAAKNTATLRIQNTDQNIETSRNINSLEESAGGTFPNDGTISITDIPIINVPPRVKSPKKKVRKSVKVYSEPFIIPPGHVWLAGDNTANSTDSRFYGPVPVALLRGRVFLKLVPKYPPFEAVISSPEILYRRTPELMDLVEDSLDLDYKNPSDSCTMVETPQNSDSKSQLLISSDHEGETKG